MKRLIQSAIFALTALIATSVSYADAVRPQSANQPAARRSVALLALCHGAGAGSSSCKAKSCERRTVSHDNGHGQSIVQFVR